MIQEGGRYKLVSDGDNNNMIMMAITKVKTTDEGEYKVVIENEHGKDEKNFMLYVSGTYLSGYISLPYMSEDEKNRCIFYYYLACPLF